MTPPTDTVTPERLATLKERAEKLSFDDYDFNKEDILPLLAHVERVEKLLKIHLGMADTCNVLRINAEAQRDRARAALKELGEGFRVLERRHRRSKCDEDSAMAAAYMRCAGAAEAKYKEVAGE